MGCCSAPSALCPFSALFVSQPSLGYLVAALVFVTGGLFCMWWCYSGEKRALRGAYAPRHHKPGILKSFCAIFRNPPLLGVMYQQPVYPCRL